MRTVSEIVGAVQEQQPCSDRELRLALLCLYYTLNMSCTRPEESSMARDNFERQFRMMKADPEIYLGENWTPGTKANTSQRELSKKILNKVIAGQGGI